MYAHPRLSSPHPAMRLLPRGRFLAAVFIVATALLSWPPVDAVRAQSDPNDDTRQEIPGHYTVGLYAEETGQGHTITLDDDQTAVDLWVGITGDSTRVFSGVIFGLDLPEGLKQSGPIKWYPIPGLKQRGNLVGGATQVEFNENCQTQKGETPMMLGRIPLTVSADFHEGDVKPVGDRRWGLSVELCDPDHAWPKPFAQPVPIHLRRKSSVWDKLKGLFH